MLCLPILPTQIRLRSLAHNDKSKCQLNNTPGGELHSFTLLYGLGLFPFRMNGMNDSTHVIHPQRKN